MVFAEYYIDPDWNLFGACGVHSHTTPITRDKLQPAIGEENDQTETHGRRREPEGNYRFRQLAGGSIRGS
jgi:hypothetical protein